ncbi:hypothetical protein [Desulfosporosinus meridiei]|uniref:Uncharacterized protein n=1 Tax=Desulfosporosinus meridiei (strain ATCC BAA-275 / DSM 13257 / KCTC 12902 / NCIMB 13706 / S10) TaxID=768704 RepID=J7ITM1_DESMD|nr:hypothetical protein [Desulfosporosinus meridiei]AFQ42448.1 hypothetical protein Desmer_0395 [Desulfosporosinus meridiei DSM 13257]
MVNKTEEIRKYILRILQQAKEDGYATKDIRAGDIKKEMGLGNIPQSICNAMRSIHCFSKYDVLVTPPSGNSTTLELRYYLDNEAPTQPECPAIFTKGRVDYRTIAGHKSKLWEQVDIAFLLNNALEYHNKLAKIENHRYRSWEHCYSFFTKHQSTTDDEVIDLMCLHLSNYLASWGMFRGAAFLLQKDYKVHLEVVHLMLNERFRILRSTNIREITHNDEYINRIFELNQKIPEIYRRKTTDFENENGRNSSDTLITKILLGVFGCVPAYDRYFKNGLSSTGVSSAQFSKRSFVGLLQFYEHYYDDFEAVRLKISEHGVEYSPMKMIDMCFWQIGFDGDTQKVESEQE